MLSDTICCRPAVRTWRRCSPLHHLQLGGKRTTGTHRSGIYTPPVNDTQPRWDLKYTWGRLVHAAVDVVVMVVVAAVVETVTVIVVVVAAAAAAEVALVY